MGAPRALAKENVLTAQMFNTRLPRERSLPLKRKRYRGVQTCSINVRSKERLSPRHEGCVHFYSRGSSIPPSSRLPSSRKRIDLRLVCAISKWIRIICLLADHRLFHPFPIKKSYADSPTSCLFHRFIIRTGIAEALPDETNLDGRVKSDANILFFFCLPRWKCSALQHAPLPSSFLVVLLAIFVVLFARR